MDTVSLQPNGIRMIWIPLTHCDRDNMAAMSQTTFSSAFSWMKMFEFRLNINWSLFLRVQLMIFRYSSIDVDNGLTPSRRQAVIWTNDGSLYRRMYASLGLNELNITASECRDILWYTWQLLSEKWNQLHYLVAHIHDIDRWVSARKT